MSNEELVKLVRAGSEIAVEELFHNNQEYLYKLARRLSSNHDTMEDLVQEGRIAILEAVSSFDSAQGVLFLTYATPFIRKTMRVFMARISLPMAVPAARYSQLRRVNYLVTNFQVDNERHSLQGLLQLICQEMKVSEKVALGLLRDYYAVYQEVALEEQWEQNIPCFDVDPSKVYAQALVSECIIEAIERLSPRERNLMLNDSAGFGMTFQELAVMLNFNGHSSAEKAYWRAIESLQKVLYEGKYGVYTRLKQTITSTQQSFPIF